jgi:hypothetical protein
VAAGGHTIQSEIAVKGGDVTRQHSVLNGKPWKKDYFPDFNWSVQFGTELQPLFGSKCGTTIEFEGRTEVRGRQLLAYRFHAPPNGCFGTLTQYTKHYSPVWTGPPATVVNPPFFAIAQSKLKSQATDRVRSRNLNPWTVSDASSEAT